MITAKEIADQQRETLKKAHNWRITKDKIEYRLRYDGGITEHFTIQGRRSTAEPFRYVNSFDAFRMSKTEEVISFARSLLCVRT